MSGYGTIGGIDFDTSMRIKTRPKDVGIPIKNSLKSVLNFMTVKMQYFADLEMRRTPPTPHKDLHDQKAKSTQATHN